MTSSKGQRTRRAETVTVLVNGRERQLVGGATVAELLADYGLGATVRGIAVAIDGEVVPRSQWAQRQLRGGEHVEIVRAVQGG